MNIRRDRLAGVVLLALAMAAPGLERPTDFNGQDADGRHRDDLAVFAPLSGTWLASTPAGMIQKAWGWGDAVPVPGDYNGDGAADVGVFFPDSGTWFLATTSGLDILLGAQWGWDRTIPMPADYDGDGRTDLGVYHRETGNWYIRTVEGVGLAWALNWGWAETKPFPYSIPSGRASILDETLPVPADYDGDGKADLAVYHRASGNWFVLSLDGRVLVMAENWGWDEARPVPGDYDGDGKADLAVFHRATGNWYIRTVAGEVLAWAENWGWRETMPVPADYNGDGRTDLGVYHAMSGAWFTCTLKGRIHHLGTQWGWDGAVPVQTLAMPASEGVTVLCFGDSTTWGGGSSTDGPDTGYPARLERKLRVRYGGLHAVRNAGNPGEATWDGRERLPGELEDYHPDLLLLMEGVNDALFDFMFDGTEGFLREMVSQAVARDVPVVIGTIPPVLPDVRSNQYNRIVTFNPTIGEIADDYFMMTAPIFESITGEPNWESNLMEPISANHPNDAGYNVMRDAWFDTIEPLFTSGALY